MACGRDDPDHMEEILRGFGEEEPEVPDYRPDDHLVTAHRQQAAKDSWSSDVLPPLNHPTSMAEQTAAIQTLQEQVNTLVQMFGAGLAELDDTQTEEERKRHGAWVRHSIKNLCNQLSELGLPTFEQEERLTSSRATGTDNDDLGMGRSEMPVLEPEIVVEEDAEPRHRDRSSGRPPRRESSPGRCRRCGCSPDRYHPDLQATFDGEAESLPCFLIQVSVYLEQWEDTFPNERAKVLFVTKHLSKEAARWALAMFDSHNPCIASIDTFMRALRRQFEDTTLERQAREGIRKVKQGNRDVYQYTREFRRYVFYLGDWPEDLLVHFYCNGLNPALQRDVIMRVREDTLEDWIHTALDTEEWLAALPKREPKQSALGHVGKPRAGATTSAGVRAGSEISRRRAQNLCFRCGKAGHFVADCPLPGLSGASSGARSGQPTGSAGKPSKGSAAKKKPQRKMEPRVFQVLSPSPETSSDDSTDTGGEDSCSSDASEPGNEMGWLEWSIMPGMLVETSD